MKHGFDDTNKNKVEVLSKEEVYALLAEAIRTGQLPELAQDTAFVTMIKDAVTGVSHKVAFVTQAQYNQLENDGELIPDAWYFITDDSTADDLDDHITQNDTRVSSMEGRVDAMEWYPLGNFPTIDALLDSARAYAGDCREMVGSFDTYKRIYITDNGSGTLLFHGYVSGFAYYVTEDREWRIYYLARVDEMESAVSTMGATKSDKPVDRTPTTINANGLYVATYNIPSTSVYLTFTLSIEDYSNLYKFVRSNVVWYRTSGSATYWYYAEYQAGTLELFRVHDGIIDDQFTDDVDSVKLVVKY